ncbi:MAG: hypothetical protein ACOYOV_14755 [Bacteroidales bacterium]
MDQDINKPNKEVLAGINLLKYVDINNVEYLENGVLKLKPGFQLRKIFTSVGKWSFDGSLSNETDNYFDFKLSGIISGHDKILLQNVLNASNSRLLLIIQTDGVNYVAGNLDEFIHTSFSNFSGALPGEESGYKINFFRKLRQPFTILTQLL